MMDSAALWYYGSLGALVALPALGVGIGQGIVGFGVLTALNQQPRAAAEIRTTFFIAVVLSEFAAIISSLMTALLLTSIPTNAFSAYAHCAIVFALAIPGFAIGLLSGFPAREAILATARQPFFSKKIRTIMLLTQSMMQMPLIFGFIISLILKTQLITVTGAADMLRIIGAGATIGISTLGPTYGLSIFTRAICHNLGLNRSIYDRLFSFTLLSQALIEAPILFALLIAFILTQVAPATGHWTESGALLAAAIIMCLGTLAPGISAGKTARLASTALKDYPTEAQHISYSNILAQTFINTNALFCMLLALLLVLYV